MTVAYVHRWSICTHYLTQSLLASTAPILNVFEQVSTDMGYVHTFTHDRGLLGEGTKLGIDVHLLHYTYL